MDNLLALMDNTGTPFLPPPSEVNNMPTINYQMDMGGFSPYRVCLPRMLFSIDSLARLPLQGDKAISGVFFTDDAGRPGKVSVVVNARMTQLHANEPLC